MNDQTDSQLLGAWAKTRSEPAFAELVRRHVDFVHSAALRMVCDSHLAKDVTQSVFVAVARDAARITDCRVLAGWLHRTAQNLAAQTVRTDVRRRAREQEAATMNELLATEPDLSRRSETEADAWAHIAPQLDAALGELSEPDRDAVLLRYFENKSLREVGQALGTSDDTAQKRVSRAVERLREFFAKRGVTVGASGLVVVISANAVQAAPVGLAVTISTAAALTGTTIAATATATAVKTIAMTTLQKTIITAAVAAAVGGGIYEACQASNLREQVQVLQQQQAPLSEQIQQLQSERDQTTRQLAALREENERWNRNTAELLKLRGETGVTRGQLKELESENARLKAGLKSSTGNTAEWPRAFTDQKAKLMEAKQKWVAAVQATEKLAGELNVPEEITKNISARTNLSNAQLAQYQPYFEALEKRDALGRFLPILAMKAATEILELETGATNSSSP